MNLHSSSISRSARFCAVSSSIFAVLTGSLPLSCRDGRGSSSAPAIVGVGRFDWSQWRLEFHRHSSVSRHWNQVRLALDLARAGIQRSPGSQCVVLSRPLRVSHLQVLRCECSHCCVRRRFRLLVSRRLLHVTILLHATRWHHVFCLIVDRFQIFFFFLNVVRSCLAGPFQFRRS